MEKQLVTVAPLVLVVLLLTMTGEAAPLWHKGDNHLHSTFSDGSGTPAATATTAKALGYGFSTLTDHNSVSGNTAFESQSTATFIGLGGEEVTRGDGHLLAYGITSVISSSGTPQASINAVINNNPGKSFCYIAHPMWSSAMTQGGDWEWHDWTVTGYTGLEVWNAYYPHNYDENYTIAAFNKWDELNNAGRHLYGMTNTDSHTSNIGNASGSSLGLGYGWNVVYAEFTKDSLLMAMKTGRFYGSNGPVINFRANGKMMGSDVSLSAVTIDSIFLSATDTANITSVKLIKNGVVLTTWTPNAKTWSTTSMAVAAKAGDFFRMTAEGTNRFAYSNPIFISGIAAPRMVTSKASYPASEPITVNFYNNNGTGSPGTGGTTTDRIAIYAVGDTPGSSHPADQWEYLDGDQTAPASVIQNGTINFNALPQGNYFVAFLSNGGYSEICARVNFTVTPASINPGITTTKVTYSPSEQITVNVSNNNGTGTPGAGGTVTDWIGIYESGDTPGAGHASTRWAYLDGDQTAPAAVVQNGTCSFAALPAGTYFAAFLSNDGYGEVCSRAVFYVSNPPYITTSKTSYTVGETITVNFFNNYGTGTPANGGTPSDWIAIYDSTGGNGHWSYLDGTQVCPLVTIRSGSLSFANFTPGTYTVRFLAYGSPDLDMQMATSIVITVMPSVSTGRNEQKSSLKTAVNFMKVSKNYAKIGFSLARQDNVTIKIHNLSGKTVAYLMMNTRLNPGFQWVSWDVRNQAAGSYYVTIHTGLETMGERVVIIP